MSGIYKELSDLKDDKKFNQKIQAKNIERHLTEKAIEMANKQKMLSITNYQENAN